MSADEEPDPLSATTRAISPRRPQAFKLSVVLPVSNEIDRILPALDHLFNLFRGLDWELVLIDLGSVDGTFEQLEHFESYANIKLLSEEEPLAKGFGHRLGALVCAGGAILLADIDRPLAPRAFRDDLELLRDEHPLLLYTPLHGDGAGGSMISKLMARRLRGTLTTVGMDPPTDPGSSVPMMRQDLAMRLFPLVDGSTRAPTFELIQLALLTQGVTFGELPVGNRWAGPRWLQMEGVVRDAKRAAKRLRHRAEALKDARQDPSD